MRKTVLSVVWLFICTISIAQSVNWEQKYLSAKSFYTEGKYALAMEAFKPLIEENEGNNYSPYASFYYALAAYKSDYLPLSRNMFSQVKAKYPSWSKIDEVNYWIGLIHFEEGSYNQAINALNEIKSKTFTKDVEGLKLNYFSKIESLDELKNVYETNPEETSVASLLASRISQETLVNQDRKLLREIIQEFSFDPSQFNMVDVQKTVFRDEYKVAVMLPFMSSDLEPNLRRKVNQFVLDMYQGIQLAADTLKAEGINIKLFAYDTKRSKKATEAILKKEELKGMDLIIGPLFPEPISAVNDFSYKNKINIINPLSSNSEVIGNNPFSFMFSPSNETIGRSSARYASRHVEKKPGIIIYGHTAADSAMAMAYKQRIEADSFNIIATKRIKKDSSQSIMDMLLIPNTRLRNASSEEAKESYTIKLDSIGHIFVASNNDLISSKVLSAVEIRGDSIVVIGSADWLSSQVIKFDVYAKLGCVLYAPNYFTRGTEEYNAFRKSYIFKHKEIPTEYVEIGFELMQLMGRGLNEHGKYFQIGWRDKGLVNGHLSAGFDYRDSNDNLVLPMLTFEEGEMIMSLKDEHN